MLIASLIRFSFCWIVSCFLFIVLPPFHFKHSMSFSPCQALHRKKFEKLSFLRRGQARKIFLKSLDSPQKKQPKTAKNIFIITLETIRAIIKNYEKPFIILY